MTIALPTTAIQAHHRAWQSKRSCFTRRPKLGQESTFASQFPEALFFECEPGLNHLEVFKVPTYKWEDFLEACKLLAKGDHQLQDAGDRHSRQRVQDVLGICLLPSMASTTKATWATERAGLW